MAIELEADLAVVGLAVASELVDLAVTQHSAVAAAFASLIQLRHG